MFTLLDIIACSASFGQRYRTRAIGYDQDMTSVELEPHLIRGKAVGRIPSGANLTDGTGRQPDIPNFDSGWFLDIDFGTSLTTEQRRIQF
jgi:hypothetical protein